MTLTTDETKFLDGIAPKLGNDPAKLKYALDKFRAKAVPDVIEYESRGDKIAGGLGKVGGAIKDISVGMGKSAVDFAQGGSQVFERLMRSGIRPFVSEETETRMGINQGQETASEELGLPEFVKGKNTAEKVGKFIGDVGQFALAGGATSGAVKGAAGFNKLSKGSQLAARGISQAVTQGLLTSTKKGRLDDPEVAAAAALAGTLEVALPLLGKGAAKLAKGGKDWLAKMNGLDPTDIQALKNTNKEIVEDFIIKSNKAGLDTAADNLMEGLGRHVDDLTQKTLIPQRQTIGKQLAAAVKQSDEIIDTKPALEKFARLIGDDFGVRVIDDVDDLGKAVKTLDFTDSALGADTNAQKAITTYIDKLQATPKARPEIIWNWTKELGGITGIDKANPASVMKASKVPLTALADDLSTTLKNTLGDDTVALFDEYGRLSKLQEYFGRYAQDTKTQASLLKKLYGSNRDKALIGNIKALGELGGEDLIQQADLAKAVMNITDDPMYLGTFKGNLEAADLGLIKIGKKIIDNTLGIVTKPFLGKEAIAKGLAKKVGKEVLLTKSGTRELMEEVIARTLKGLAVERVSGSNNSEQEQYDYTQDDTNLETPDDEGYQSYE